MCHNIPYVLPLSLGSPFQNFIHFTRRERKLKSMSHQDLYCYCDTIIAAAHKYLFDSLLQLYIQCRLMLLGNNMVDYLKLRDTKKERAMPREETRDRLLQSGIELFGKHGFQEVSLNKLARTAKTSSSSILHFFVNKKGLFEVIIDGVWREINDEIARVLNTDDSAATKCEEILETVLKFLKSHPEKERILLLEAKHLRESEELLSGNMEEDRFKETLDKILREGKNKGIFPHHLSVPAAREGLLGLLNGMLVGRLEEKYGRSTNKYSNKAIMDVVRWSIQGLSIIPVKTKEKR